MSRHLWYTRAWDPEVLKAHTSASNIDASTSLHVDESPQAVGTWQQLPRLDGRVNTSFMLVACYTRIVLGHSLEHSEVTIVAARFEYLDTPCICTHGSASRRGLNQLIGVEDAILLARLQLGKGVWCMLKPKSGLGVRLDGSRGTGL